MSHNDLAAIPEEYTKKKEEQLAKNTVKRMSAQQRQYNKVSICKDIMLHLELHQLSHCKGPENQDPTGI